MTIGASGQVCASTQSGRASQNLAAVVGAFARAFENGEISLPQVKEALDGLAVSSDEEESDAVDLSFAITLESWTRDEFNTPLVPYARFSVWAAAEVYSLQTQDAISSFKSGARALLISAQPTSAELIDASPEKYWKNTENWASFKDTATGALCLSVRGTATSGFLQSFADNMTSIDANAYNTTLFDNKVHRGFLDVVQAVYSDVRLIRQEEEQPSSCIASFTLKILAFSTNAVDAVHCITFDSAAIASVPNPISSGCPTNRVIFFVNLKDPVPRADLAYALWVVDALGKYLTRITDDSKMPAYTPLPPQLLFPGGEMVLLDGDGDAAENLTPSMLQSLAFLDLQAHGKKEYVRVVQSVFASLK
ncbi:hypothetical protein HETIRDRAFT_448317 [Heterobasidion irregulare TC 32-1]|uniref:Uncharacterized protein n=1 Tax=Heterobasidion irregulare (strain TC 32-1) TaxID=747525 RepID=W4KIE0_HETIT|nr:uncharacterized protein HETIRDRAFT_448317 [Heterobasidion irregulare TC 32-1]ETW85080.1 hypothetical protein HETIRDRAFT_448317 [Heterobasidion irregulare TC 32-1]